MADEQYIEGYAVLWDDMSSDLGGFREQFKRGAFARALAEGQDVLCVLSHDEDQLLGRTRSKTCTVMEDDKGLRYRCMVGDTMRGRDAYAMVKRGDISQSSFQFSVDEDDWDEMGDGSFLRTVRSVRFLHDVSPVINPAYPNTSVNAA
jgi:HK97 family phage prohead protease